jgi:hypothetical protein
MGRCLLIEARRLDLLTGKLSRAAIRLGPVGRVAPPGPARTRLRDRCRASDPEEIGIGLEDRRPAASRARRKTSRSVGPVAQRRSWMVCLFTRCCSNTSSRVCAPPSWEVGRCS